MVQGLQGVTRKILVVDDEPSLQKMLAHALEREGFQVQAVGDGEEALEAFKTYEPHLIVLDIMLPKLDGTEVCRRIRAQSDVPIIMLTAKDDEIDRVVGLELGADDYLTKPFSLRELLARIRAVLRRGEGAPPGPGAPEASGEPGAKGAPTRYRFAGWELDLRVRGLSEVLCLGPHDAAEGAIVCRDANSLPSRMSCWTSSWVAPIPGPPWPRAACWTGSRRRSPSGR